jgi:DNA-binding LacI/PurR family transcriptional regulator
MGDGGAKKRLTIGLAIDDILMVGGRKALHGVIDLARERDFNLLCFHFDLCHGAGLWPAAWDSMGEILDGLIVYQSWPNEEAFAVFRDRFPSLPMLNALRFYKGCPGVTPDSYRGEVEIVSHLIEAHGYRRIAFVAGPEGNWSAQERYRGYVDALAGHGLPLDPNLVTPPLGWASGQRAVALFMDERRLRPGTGFEAVAAANDTIAVGMLDEFLARGVQVPGDAAVVGFDDDPRAFFSTPPLSTVGYDTGRHAAEILLAMLAGERVPERSLAPAGAVIRRSCGCQYEAVRRAAFERPEGPAKRARPAETVPARRSQALADMARAVAGGPADAGTAAGWAGGVFDAFVAALAAGGRDGSPAFLSSLEKALRQAKAAGRDLAAWPEALAALRRHLFPFLDGDELSRAQGLWQQAYVLLEETTRREQASRAYRAEQLSQTLRETETALLTVFSVGGLTDILARDLPRLGIPGCYLALYEDAPAGGSPHPAGEWSRLALACGEAGPKGPGRAQLEAGGARFRSRRLVPDGMLPDRRYAFVVEPLHFRERPLGFAAFEIGPTDGALYENLRRTIGSALQGALLLEQVQKHAVQLDAIATQTQATSEAMQLKITEASRQAQAVSRSAQVSLDVSQTGRDAVANAIAGMEAIQRQVAHIAQSIQALSTLTRQIGEINGAMEGIVAKSEILAINAGIQAARAGDQGLGFGVVAGEMRRLTEQSRAATSTIGKILGEIQNAADKAVKVTEEGSEGTRQGMELAARAGEAIQDLSATIKEAALAAIQIAASTDQQTNAMDQLVKAVNSIKEASAQTSTSFKEVGL